MYALFKVEEAGCYHFVMREIDCLGATLRFTDTDFLLLHNQSHTAAHL
jgi:hypothetical protein